MVQGHRRCGHRRFPCRAVFHDRARNGEPV